MLKDRLDEAFRRNPSAVDLREDLEGLLSEIEARLRPKAVVLAGSMARGEFVMGMSDVDLLVIADESGPRSILRALGDVDVEITIYAPEEICHAVKGGNQYIADAVENGIPLKGEEVVRRLRRLLKVGP